MWPTGAPAAMAPPVPSQLWIGRYSCLRLRSSTVALEAQAHAAPWSHTEHKSPGQQGGLARSAQALPAELWQLAHPVVLASAVPPAPGPHCDGWRDLSPAHTTVRGPPLCTGLSFRSLCIQHRAQGFQADVHPGVTHQERACFHPGTTLG